MDLTPLSQIVAIVGGIIAIIRGLQELTKGVSEGKSTLPELTNIITKLVIAMGIVVTLYGGLVIFSATSKIDTTRKICLQGRDANSYEVNNFCDQFADSKYNKDIKPGFLVIGISFILIGIALFVRTFKIASVLLFILEIILLLLGVWLMKTNL